MVNETIYIEEVEELPSKSLGVGVFNCQMNLTQQQQKLLMPSSVFETFAVNDKSKKTEGHFEP